MNIETRRSLMEYPVTLNGSPARVSGAQEPFAMVRDLRTGLGHQYAWETVAYVIANKAGRFS